MRANIELTIRTFKNAGFMINFDKSHLTPSRRIEFLGFVLDSTKFTISLTTYKISSLQKLINDCIKKSGKSLTIRDLSRIIGKIVATFPCCSDAPLHYRTLDRFKIKCLLKHKNKWNAHITLSPPCLQELKWLTQNMSEETFTKSLHAVEISEHVYSDTSGTAFGSWWREKTVQSKFSESQAGLSINTKELLAIYYTLSTFGAALQGAGVLVHCDNTVAVTCIRKRNSADPLIHRITQKIFYLSKLYNFSLQGTYIEGKRNGRADSLSRKILVNTRTEWSIPKPILTEVLKFLEWTPDIDLFASHLNFKFNRFCSRVPDLKAFHIDAFTLNWSNYKCYCFCPFSIIGKVLRKIESDNIRHTALIMPFHPSSAWFPRFIMMCQNILILLPPETSSQLFLPWDKSVKHPLKNHMHLILGDLCSSSFSTMAYTPGQRVIL